MMQIRVDLFSMELRNILQEWRLAFDRELQKTGYTLTTALVLIYTHEAVKPMTQKEMAQSLYIEEPSLVRVLDKLEQDGMVLRQVAEKDRRSKHIVLTEQALPVVVQLTTSMQVLRVKLLGNIHPEKLKVAFEVLQMISSNLSLLRVA